MARIMVKIILLLSIAIFGGCQGKADYMILSNLSYSIKVHSTDVYSDGQERKAQGNLDGGVGLVVAVKMYKGNAAYAKNIHFIDKTRSIYLEQKDLLELKEIHDARGGTYILTEQGLFLKLNKNAPNVLIRKWSKSEGI